MVRVKDGRFVVECCRNVLSLTGIITLSQHSVTPIEHFANRRLRHIFNENRVDVLRCFQNYVEISRLNRF